MTQVFVRLHDHEDTKALWMMVSKCHVTILLMNWDGCRVGAAGQPPRCSLTLPYWHSDLLVMLASTIEL